MNIILWKKVKERESYKKVTSSGSWKRPSRHRVEQFIRDATFPKHISFSKKNKERVELIETDPDNEKKSSTDQRNGTSGDRRET